MSNQNDPASVASWRILNKWKDGLGIHRSEMEQIIRTDYAEQERRHAEEIKRLNGKYADCLKDRDEWKELGENVMRAARVVERLEKLVREVRDELYERVGFFKEPWDAETERLIQAAKDAPANPALCITCDTPLKPAEYNPCKCMACNCIEDIVKKNGGVGGL